jgi:hypothetical protein
MFTDRTVTVKQHQVPVIEEVDVLVVGGGIAGVGAAIAAARNKANTLLVEREGCLGGLATLGLVSLPGGFAEGIAAELVARLKSAGGIHGRMADPETLKYVLERMVLESGARLLYWTYVIDAIMDDNVLRGVITHSISGRQAMLAGRTVDASGDADVAALAGVPFEKGSPSHGGYNQAPSLQLRVGNVNWQRYVHAAKSPGWQQELLDAVQAGDLPELYDKYVNWMIRVPGRPEEQSEVIVCLAHSRNCDCTSVKDLTRMMIEQRQQVQHLVVFLRKYIPGFEQCWLIDTSPLMGVRESRRIVGEYVMTGEDIVYARKFPDAIARDCHGLDVHHPTDVGHIKHIDVPQPDGTVKEVRFKPGEYNEIPYRSLVPLKIDNLLVAGRCISADFLAQSGTRLVLTCMHMGNAAGTAAALSLHLKVTPRGLDPHLLRQRLIEQGTPLHRPPGRLGAMGDAIPEDRGLPSGLVGFPRTSAPNSRRRSGNRSRITPMQCG